MNEHTTQKAGKSRTQRDLRNKIKVDRKQAPLAIGGAMLITPGEPHRYQMIAGKRDPVVDGASGLGARHLQNSKMAQAPQWRNIALPKIAR